MNATKGSDGDVSTGVGIRWGGLALLAVSLAIGVGIALPDQAHAGSQPITGSLTQPDGTYGCISQGGTGGCAIGRGLNEATSVVVSPDNRFVYAASVGSGAVTTFSRNPRTGALRQLRCVSSYATKRCTAGRGLDGSFDLALSPDGNHLYVAAFVGLAVFERNRATGRLTQLHGPNGCVSQALSQYQSPVCGLGRALLDVKSVTVSPDGQNVYAASKRSSAVAVFARDRQSGAIRQLKGPAGCVSSQRSFDNCLDGRALGGASSVAVSPKGDHVYVTGAADNSVVLLRRNPIDGVVQQPTGTDGCVDEYGFDGCARGRGLLAPSGVVVSGDGRNVYAASYSSNAVVTLNREAVTGALVQKRGPFWCTSQRGTEGCSSGRALGGVVAVAMGPDDKNVYAVSSESNAVMSLYRNTRDRSRYGALTQFLQRSEVCTSKGGLEHCLPGRGLSTGSGLALSPDGRNAYVASFGSNAIAIFSRNGYRARISLRASGPRRGCVSRDFTVRVRVISTLPVRSIGVRLNRRSVHSRRGAHEFRVRIPARRMRPGRYRLRITATDVVGNPQRKSIRFARCPA